MQVKYTKPSVLVERSDIDHHQNIKQQDLGEHLGDGFFLNYQPIVIHRDLRTGRIRKTESVAEYHSRLERRAAQLTPEQVEVAQDVLPILKPVTTSQRDQIVALMATKLMAHYQAQLISDPQLPNPLRDGIPMYSDGSWVLELDPRRKAEIKRMAATPAAVYEWLKAMMGARATLVNKKKGWKGPDLGLMDKKLQVTRKVSVQ